ncbi:Spermidine/putrescine import ATP-binding protein PotA [Candidatus Desulfosporosinus infrequens]|uniref:ABC-type quaternary amine transporter n=1 Tax=Candidatus Desulfosporosinus infrequens TaxID=2043169 RepID=A0A2U3LB96_9FIRM|nr:Spermidine/putrescine import ATP-binding protein PotA [Candidatus Desulfosporosinus infrequens]
MQERSFITIDKVTKSFGEFKALDSVSLDIPIGSFTTLLGPSGCGKTTLLRLIAGFYEADQGNILLEGQRVNGIPPYKRYTPLVFQEYALFPHMTVAENITYGLKFNKTPKEDIPKKLQEMLQIFELQNLDHRLPKQLSGGQQQRVAFARALILGQKVLLLDEPLSNLDAKLRVEVRNELRAIQKRLGITTVYVTHDQDEALAMSDVVAVFEKGHIRQIGTPWEVYFQPNSRFVADFVGTANFLEGEVIHDTAGKLIVQGQDYTLYLNKNRHSRQKGDRVTLVLRPESLLLESGEVDQGESLNTLAGEITDNSFLGRVMRYWVKVGNIQLIVDDCNPANHCVFQGKVRLTIDSDRIHILHIL